MNEKVLNYIKEFNMINPNESVVVGVSGGSDSMCLLGLLLELRESMNLKLHVVHIHHGIRGIEADEDMAFVENFCKERDIAFYGFKYEVVSLAREKGLSTEEMGRILRYDAFYKIAKEHNGKIAVAHNMEDMAETVLFNLFRGSGIKGLVGIQPVRDNIIRPIMCLSKEEIYAYLKEMGISYRVDKTNFEDEYTRNKIRLNVLPYIKENINNKATQHIFQTSRTIFEAEEYIEDAALKVYKDYSKENANQNEVFFNIHMFDKPHILVSYAIRQGISVLTNSLKDITNGHVESIISLSNVNAGNKVSLPYSLYAIKEYDGIKLSKKMDTKKIEAVEITGYGTWDIPWKRAKLLVEKDQFSQDIFKENLYTKWVDYDILEDNLSVRTRKSGDYIVVNDCGQRKKLNRFFVDNKVPQDIRDSIVLVASGSRILWIVGYRIGADVKVNDDSTHIIRLDYFE